MKNIELPNDILAEQSLLSSCMMPPIEDAIMAIDSIKPEDFYLSAHKTIFKAIGEVISSGGNPDVVEVGNVLKTSGEFVKLGTVFSNIFDAAPPAPNMDGYIEIIREKAVRRRIILKAQEVMRNAYHEDYKELMNGVDEFKEVEGDGGKDDFASGEEIASKNIERYERQNSEKGTISGVPSKFFMINHTMGGWKPKLYIIAGRPSMGKSAFALGEALYAAEAGFPVAFFSLEMPSEEIGDRAFAAKARINSMRFTSGSFSPSEWEKITDAGSRLSDMGIYVDDTPELTPRQLRRKARMAKRKYGIKMVVVDYIQLMTADRPSNQRHLEIGQISRSLKVLAGELKVPVLALSQLNRKLEDRDKKRPRLSDLRESGSLEQDADVVMFTHRPIMFDKEHPDPLEAELIVEKNRGGERGTINMQFIKEISSFEPLSN